MTKICIFSFIAATAAVIVNAKVHDDHNAHDLPFRPPDVNPGPSGQDPVTFAEDISADPYVFESERLPWEDGTRSFPSVANGHIATNIYTDTIYMNGLYNGYLGDSYRARIHSLHASNISVEGGNVYSQKFTLDTRHGIFEENLNTSVALVRYRTYAHNFFTRLMVTEVYIKRVEGVSGEITVVRETLGGEDSADFTWGPEQLYNMTFVQRKGTTVQAESNDTSVRDVYLYYNQMGLEWTLVNGELENTYTYILSIDTDQELAKQHFDAGIAELIAPYGLTELRTRHTSNWKDIWAKGNIELESSDLHLQKAIAGSLYYLYSNLPSRHTFTTNTQFYGLSPGGLANGDKGEDYYGHVFWDQETWMYPGVLMFRPDLAADMLSYRINAMEPAFSRAAEGDYQGTRFPWESAYSGHEVTPDICVPCRENQQHITGDIAYAARQFVAATRDLDWLLSGDVKGGRAGAEERHTGEKFVREMARFWFSRPSWNNTKERYEINGVMPPDEHQEDVKNSVYTNLLANYAVHTARWTACLAGLDAEEEVPDRWLNVAQNLVFTYNEEKRYHEEFEGYDEEVENNQTHPSGIKQADVALLGFPLLWTMPDDVRRNDLLHYEPRTNPEGPAMTWSMFSVSWMDLGEEEKAAQLFRRSYEPYVRQPFKIWTEVQEGIGAVNFITGAGGFLQSLVFGYGGLRLHPEVLEIRDTFLPPGTTVLRLRDVNYLGNTFDLELTAGEMNLTHTGMLNETEGGYNLTLEYKDGDTVKLDSIGKSYLFQRQNVRIYSTEPSGCEPPIDIITDLDYEEDVPEVNRGSTLNACMGGSVIVGLIIGVLTMFVK